MAPKGTINLGFIKAIHSGVNPPLNKKMVWYDENEFVHKAWDVVNETWDYFKINPGQLNSKADRNSSNLTDEDILSWREKLELFTKTESLEKFMQLQEFTYDGKIRADKIEALGLTEIILTNEVGISEFVLNQASYEFQKNDIIAVLNSQGTYDLYIYIGYDKSDMANYLATGLSNITIGMVQGLQAALDSKLDKPSSTGSYYLTKIVYNGTAYYQYNVIDLQPGDIPVSRGSFIGASVIYESLGNKIGVNTKIPQEFLDVNGNTKSISYKFTLQPTITPQPNMLVAKTDGSGLVWYNNSSVGNDLVFKSDIDTLTNGKLDKPTLLSSGNVPKWNSTANNFVGGSIYNTDDGKIGILKTNPDETLDVGGNVKAIDFKGQSVKFNLQTSISPTPNTLVPKTDGSGLSWYDNNSVKKAVLLEGESSKTNLVNYLHSSNAEIYISAINYATGYITTSIPHNLTIGTRYRGFVMPNAFKNKDFYNYKRDWQSVPIEFLNGAEYIEAIDANTVVLKNYLLNIVTVNTSDTSNVALNFNNWHIEIMGTSRIEFPVNNNSIKDFTLEYDGFLSCPTFSFMLNTDSGVINNANNGTDIALGIFGAIVPHVVSGGFPRLSGASFKFSIDKKISALQATGWTTTRNNGASSYSFTALNQLVGGSLTKFLIFSENIGLAKLVIDYGYLRIANGTTIKLR